MLLYWLPEVRERKDSFTPLTSEVGDGALPPSKTLKMENSTVLQRELFKKMII